MDSRGPGTLLKLSPQIVHVCADVHFPGERVHGSPQLLGEVPDPQRVCTSALAWSNHRAELPCAFSLPGEPRLLVPAPPWALRPAALPWGASVASSPPGSHQALKQCSWAPAQGPCPPGGPISHPLSPCFLHPLLCCACPPQPPCSVAPWGWGAQLPSLSIRGLLLREA